MNEDPKMNELVRDALESRGAFQFRPPLRRTVFPWIVSSLSAASVAVGLAVYAWVAPTESDALATTIAFLSEVDGLEIAPGEAAEMLVAWQEAPLCL